MKILKPLCRYGSSAVLDKTSSVCISTEMHVNHRGCFAFLGQEQVQNNEDVISSFLIKSKSQLLNVVYYHELSLTKRHPTVFTLENKTWE